VRANYSWPPARRAAHAYQISRYVFEFEMLEPEEIDNRKDLSKVTNEPAFIETETTVKNAVDAKAISLSTLVSDWSDYDEAHI
jgi:hypothetical protein